MFRSVGLTPKLVVVTLFVLWPTLTVTFLVFEGERRISAEDLRRRDFSAVSGFLLDLAGRYELPADTGRVQDEFLRLAQNATRLESIALFDSDPSGELRQVAGAARTGEVPPIDPGDASVLGLGRAEIRRSARGGRDLVMILAPIEAGGVDYLLRAEYAESGEDRPEILNLQNLLLIGLAGSLAITAGLALFVRYAVTRPINLLSRAMSDIRSARPGRVLPVLTEDQLGALIRTFNEMSRDLKAAADENRRLVRELTVLNQGLEARIGDATRDLVHKNEELRDTQERLYGVQQDVARMERLATLGQLSSTLAHELSTPLNVMVGHLELLSQDLSDREGPLRRVLTLKAQVDRLVGILRDTLSALRLPDPKLERVGLVGFVDEMIRFVLPSIESRGIEIVRALPAEEVGTRADRQKLQQVVINLFSNAIQATPDGGRIHAGIEVAGDRVAMRIRDTGPGIPQEHLPRLFEPFFTTKALGRGTGLGLAISHEIVRRHGGTIAARNHPEGGAEFEIVLALDPVLEKGTR